jgi:hypothetical protein
MGERSKALEAYRRALDAGGTAMPQAVRERINSAIGRVAK